MPRLLKTCFPFSLPFFSLNKFFSNRLGRGFALLTGTAMGVAGALAQTANPPATGTNLGSAAVGTSTPAQGTVTFTVGTGGALGTTQVVTLGVANLDFTLGTGSTCGGTVAGGTSCTVNVLFKPLASGLRLGAVNLVNASNVVIATAFVSGTGIGPRVVFTPGVISTVAGDGTYCSNPLGACGDGGPAGSAQIGDNHGIAVDGRGNFYLPDRLDERVRKVTVASGIISTVAGTGADCPTPGAAGCGDGGPAPAAKLYRPDGVAIDGAGNLYIADELDPGRVRKVNAATGTITTVATGFSFPGAMAVDGSGNVFVADTNNNMIKKIAAATGTVTVVAGGGAATGTVGDGGPATSALLLSPLGVAVDGAGNLYIGDAGFNRVRKVTAATGVISTIAGNGAAGYGGDGGLAVNAAVSNPQGVVTDGAGDVYFADSFNAVVREIDAAGTISTVAGNGTSGYSGDGGSALAAALGTPAGVALDDAGDLYITDLGNHHVRKVSATAAALAFASTAVGTTSDPQTVTVSNTGTAPLNFAVPASGINPALTAGYLLGTSGTCPQISASGNTASLAAGASCTEVISLKPATASATNAGTLTLTDDNLNVAGSTQAVTLSGPSTGTTVISTTTTGLSGLTTQTAGTPFTLTVRLTPQNGVTTTPTGNVVVTATPTAGGAAITLATVTAAQALSSGGYATQVTLPAAGSYSVTATYAGDANFSASSGSLVITAAAAAKTTPTIDLSLVTATATVGGKFTFSSGYTFPGTLLPTGNVIIQGTDANGTITPIASYPASNARNSLLTILSVNAPPSGVYALQAVYAGDANFNAASSNVVTLTVSAAGPTTTTLNVSGPATVAPGAVFITTLTLAGKTTQSTAPTGNITLTASPSTGAAFQLASIPATQALVSGGTQVSVALSGAGTYTLTANYAGDANYGPSTGSIGVTVLGGSATLTLTGPASTLALATQTYTVKVTGSTAGLVPIGGAPGEVQILGSLNGGAKTSLGMTTLPLAALPNGAPVNAIFPSAGTWTVVANFVGTGLPDSAPLTVVVGPPVTPAFSMTLDDANLRSGGSLLLDNTGPFATPGNIPIAVATTTMTLTATNGFNTPVSFYVLQPVDNGVVYASGANNSSGFNVDFLDATTNTPITFATPLPAGTKVVIRCTATGFLLGTHNAKGPGTAAASGLLCLGFLFWSRRRLRAVRAVGLLCTILIVVACGSLMAGCTVLQSIYPTVEIEARPINAIQGATNQRVSFVVHTFN